LAADNTDSTVVKTREWLWSLLPNGSIWQRVDNSYLNAMVSLVSTAFAKVIRKTRELYTEIHPTKASDLSPWVQVFRLPANEDPETIRQLVIQRLGRSGSISRDFHLSLIRRRAPSAVMDRASICTSRAGILKAGQVLQSGNIEFCVKVGPIPVEVAVPLAETLSKVTPYQLNYIFVFDTVINNEASLRKVAARLGVLDSLIVKTGDRFRIGPLPPQIRALLAQNVLHGSRQLASLCDFV